MAWQGAIDIILCQIEATVRKFYIVYCLFYRLGSYLGDGAEDLIGLVKKQIPFV